MNTIKQCETNTLKAECKLRNKIKRSNSDPYDYFSKTLEQ